MGRSIWISTSFVALMWCTAANAQEAPAAPEAEAATVEEVVVTAERRTTNLQEAPIAAAVMSGKEIADRGVTTIEQLQFATPSLTVQNSGQGNSFNIRGIGKTENSSSVGVGVITYRDGVAVFPAYFQSEPLYDLQSVEVLRGPQGTFAGQNATGGAVFITQRKPTLGDFNGYAQGQYGNYNDLRLQGAINVPVGDTLAVRLAFNTQSRDSFYKVVAGSPTTGGTPGEVNNYSLRGTVLWEPIDALSVQFSTDYSMIDLGGYPSSPTFSPLDLFDIATNGPYAAVDETTRSVLNVGYEFPNGIKLKSITGYQYGNTMVRADTDGGATLPFRFFDDVNQSLWSQEVNLVSPDEGRLSWVVGAYYQYDLIRFPKGGFVTNSGFDITLQGRNPKTTWAGFGQIGFDITDRLEVQVGARYSKSTVVNDAVSAIPAFGISLAQYDKREEDAVTGKVALNWRVTDDQFLYAFVAKGHKAGGINGVNIAFVPPTAFEGEDVVDYELGWKADWFDGQLKTQVGGYYDTYENFQIVLGDPTTVAISSIVNVTGETVIYGVEATAQARFGDFSINTGLTFAHSELPDYFAADSRRPRTGPCNPDTGPATGNCVNVEGNSQTYAPEMTFNLGVAYDFVFDGGKLTPRIDYSHISETWTTIFANETFGDKLAERDIVNAQLTYQNGDWTVEAFSTNLTDQQYIGSIKSGQRYAGAPRQYGVRLRVNF
ncbi:MAG: hypothetical protein JWR84_1649 [Caulobacter sp.]|nr:hypothetical protein [Caulobacter sp.]